MVKPAHEQLPPQPPMRPKAMGGAPAVNVSNNVLTGHPVAGNNVVEHGQELHVVEFELVPRRPEPHPPAPGLEDESKRAETVSGVDDDALGK